jgi:hypothetical protein
VNVSLKFPFTALNPPDPDTTYLSDANFLKEIGCSQSFPKVQAGWKAYLANRNNPKPKDRANGTLAYGVSFEKGANAGGAKIQGNVITVPEFGKIFLAELAVECDTFHLTMIRLDMGCIAKGMASFSVNIANGQSYP